MVSPNLVKKIPIAIGIKPSQPTTFTNKTIDCGPGNGNVISNLPNTSFEHSSLTINGVTIALGENAIVGGVGGSVTFVRTITAGSGINVNQSSGDVEISTASSSQTLDEVLTEGNSTAQDIISTGKIYYSNNFATLPQLPSATDYHGMFAHVHSEGHGYFAHAGAWTQLLDTGSSIDELSNVNTAGVSTGDVLKYDGTAWVAGTDNAGSGGSGIALTDLSVTSNAASGNGSLSYNSTNGVFTFTPADTSGTGGATDLDGLTDVTISSPSTGQVLKYNGTAWINDVDSTGGGSGLQSRTTAAQATPAGHADGTAEPLTIAAGKTYALHKIQTSAAAWVTVYTSQAARTADASRPETTDPLPGAGVVAEVITSDGATVALSPGIIGYNDEGTPAAEAYLKVVNKSGTAQPITVTLYFVALEA